MTDQFREKTVVVTGAGVGIGYALCRAFAFRGATVALTDIDEPLAQKAAQQINAEIGAEQVHPYGFDVADVEATKNMINEFAAKTGRLDVAIANAGLTDFGGFLEYTPEAFDRLTSVNLRGSYFTAQAAARVMIAKQISGRIVLMSSVNGQRATLNLGAYGITKAGIQHMARTLAVELGKHSITVNAISPGAILTERNLRLDPNFEQTWANMTPTTRVGYVEDIVATALFLASAEARQVTGQVITVDGGWSLSSPLPDTFSNIGTDSDDSK